MDTEKQRQRRRNDVRLTESGNARSKQLLMMPTESLTNREWLTGELLSGLEHWSPGFFLGMKYRTCCWSGWSGSLPFTHALIHENFTSHTTHFPLPSPPTHDSLSLHRLHILGGHLCSVHHLFFGLFLLKSNDKSDRGIISTVFVSSHTNSNYTQTHRSTGHGLVS